RTGRRYVAGAVHGGWVGLVAGYEAGVGFGQYPRRPAVDLAFAVATALVLYAGVHILGRPAARPNASGS
ncbi:MAG: hypothetical protein JWO31_3701, partial [Phycisphaerales bacterium]|nr:hypothetical protein [Phycisphaerales bacterium]